MKSFTEYLTESKKVYEFKLKVVGDIPKDATTSIKAALSQFKVESVSSGKSTPIQEQHSEFPAHKNCAMTVFNISTCYPANSLQVRDLVAAKLSVPAANIIARTLAEEKEDELNHANDTVKGEALLGKDYEAASEGKKLVGSEHTMSLLKELSKTKKTGEQVKGINDELLASGAPKHVKETPGKQPEIKTKFANLFTKTKHVDPLKGAKK